MKHEAQNELRFWLLGLYIVGILALVRFVIIPVSKENVRLFNRLKSLEKKKVALSKLTLESELIDAEMKKINRLLGDFQKRFFRADVSDLMVSSALIDAVFQSTTKNRIELMSCEIGKPDLKNGLLIYPVEVKMRGNFIQLKNTILELKRRKKFLHISSVKIQAGEKALSIALAFEGIKLK